MPDLPPAYFAAFFFVWLWERLLRKLPFLKQNAEGGFPADPAESRPAAKTVVAILFKPLTVIELTKPIIAALAPRNPSQFDFPSAPVIRKKSAGWSTLVFTLLA